MKQVPRLTLAMLALVALASLPVAAQSGGTQKPPDAPPSAAPQKPAAVQELPAEAKAFNAAMAEKNPLKRAELLDKFLADNPKAAASLVNRAKMEVSSALLAALKESRTKYQAVIDTEVQNAKKTVDVTPLYMTYNSIASRLLGASIFSDEAEDFARKGVAGMDERTYLEMRKKQYERSLAAYEKATAGQSQPEQPAPSAASTGPNYTFTVKDGVMQAAIAPPRPAPATSAARRAPTKPTMPTEEEMRKGLAAERASALSTLGQLLVKRGKVDEGVKALKNALAAKPSSYTTAAIARTLYETAKTAGNENDQLDYLTALVLSGRETADELKTFDAAYRKAHNGSADGMEAMLDERWKRENVRFAVAPFSRPAGVKSVRRTVLAEVFPGSG